MTTQDYASPGYDPEVIGLFDHLDIATTMWWRVLHGVAFFIGGSTFIVGSALFFFPSVPNYLFISAVFYIVGSFGFLFVDLQEFFTYRDNSNLLRTNISLSATGSLFYVIGSVGFLPSVYDTTAMVGIWGFILGSAFIFGSQSWKVTRIIREDLAETDESGAKRTGFTSLRNCSKTAIGVEADAGLGALMFLIGTVMYLVNLEAGSVLVFDIIIWIWILGSIFFTIGSLFLNYRHFLMKLCR